MNEFALETIREKPNLLRRRQRTYNTYLCFVMNYRIYLKLTLKRPAGDTSRRRRWKFPVVPIKFTACLQWFYAGRIKKTKRYSAKHDVIVTVRFKYHKEIEFCFFFFVFEWFRNFNKQFIDIAIGEIIFSVPEQLFYSKHFVFSRVLRKIFFIYSTTFFHSK